jgi:pimeloyl-ACP methyl ester carboxylesterase
MTSYQTIDVGGLDLFYREAGPRDAPSVLLLHGFPSSSAQFQPLIDRLSDRFRLIAPDYPGFGGSEAPAGKPLTFDYLADAVESFIGKIGLGRAALYMFAFGGPVGLRLATRNPELVESVIIQNANAYEEGFGPAFGAIQGLWADPKNAAVTLRPFLTIEGTKSQYVAGVVEPSSLNPDTWTLDQAYHERPGRAQGMLDLLLDFPSNVALYRSWQEFLRERRPPALIVWGENDLFFPAAGAHAYLADLPEAELHLYPTGHFALATHAEEIAADIRAFLTRRSASQS